MDLLRVPCFGLLGPNSVDFASLASCGGRPAVVLGDSGTTGFATDLVTGATMDYFAAFPLCCRGACSLAWPASWHLGHEPCRICTLHCEPLRLRGPTRPLESLRCHFLHACPRRQSQARSCFCAVIFVALSSVVAGGGAMSRLTHTSRRAFTRFGLWVSPTSMSSGSLASFPQCSVQHVID